jgi:outer membrane protein OmpA-like peptidoglycan-associated protein
MRKRYILTESQLRRVIDSQVKNHLNEDILEEGPKEWILAGLLTLSSLAGLSQTKKTIEYDPAKIEQAEKVQDMLENGEISEDIFNQANIDLNRENLEKLINVDVEDATMDVYKTGSKSVTKSKLKQDYVISGIKITNDTILPADSSVFVTADTLEFGYSSDASFVTGTYQVTKDYTDSLNKVVNNIKNSNGLITNVIIISSTDREPIKMTNEVLAQKRAEAVKVVLDSLTKKYSLGKYDVTIETLPDRGPNIYNRKMTSSERKDAREETAHHRFVKVIIEYEVEIKTEIPATVPEIIERYSFELVKAKEKQDIGTYKFGKKTKPTKPEHKKPRCKRVKIKDKGLTDCPLDFSAQYD